ncbi:2'-5' RNA ligase family protein [Candidatus Woesearchaeota archaeon]|nr:2'-5' RNA ligase family protein [Candidatus Woesearchaeota archaeon]
MEYVLVYLIRGKTQKYHQKLVKEVGPKFGERYMIENPLPSHITLKSPFELDNSKELEYTLKLFVKKHKSSKIKVVGFGNFRRFVAFLKIKLSKQSIKIQKDLLKEIRKIKGIELHKFDIKWKPHAAISYCNTKESFDKIWDYLKTLDKPKFELNFDNITILSKPKKLWKIYRFYKLR